MQPSQPVKHPKTSSCSTIIGFGLIIVAVIGGLCLAAWWIGSTSRPAHSTMPSVTDQVATIMARRTADALGIPTPTPEDTATAPAPTPTSDFGITAYFSARDYVEKHLKAPATARWSDLYNADNRTGYHNLGGGKYEAYGYVDSQNSFGALLRNDWRVVMQIVSATQYQVLYMRIGDTAVGDYSAALDATAPAQR
jgi:hypothetical protein